MSNLFIGYKLHDQTRGYSLKIENSIQELDQIVLDILAEFTWPEIIAFLLQPQSNTAIGERIEKKWNHDQELSFVDTIKSGFSGAAYIFDLEELTVTMLASGFKRPVQGYEDWLTIANENGKKSYVSPGYTLEPSQYASREKMMAHIQKQEAKVKEEQSQMEWQYDSAFAIQPDTVVSSVSEMELVSETKPDSNPESIPNVDELPKPPAGIKDIPLWYEVCAGHHTPGEKPSYGKLVTIYKSKGGTYAKPKRGKGKKA